MTTNDDHTTQEVKKEPEASLFFIEIDDLEALAKRKSITVIDKATGEVTEHPFTMKEIEKITELGWYYWVQYEGWPESETILDGPYKSEQDAYDAGMYAWHNDKLKHIRPQTIH